MVDPPNKVCVLTDPYLRDHQAQSLERAIDEAEVEVSLVLVNDTPNPAIDPELVENVANGQLGIDAVRLFIQVLKRDGAWALVYLEKKLAEQLGSSAASSESIPVSEVSCFSNSEIKYITPIMDGSWSELPPDIVRVVRENCDVVVRYGFGLLKGEILTATEFGVLSFHPADIREYRGLGAPQAWIDGREGMGVTLQRLTEEIDGGEIVAYKEIDVSECVTLWEVYDALRNLYPELLVEGIFNLRDPSIEITAPESLGPYYSTTTRRKPSFAAQTILKNITGHVKRVMSGRTPP